MSLLINVSGKRYSENYILQYSTLLFPSSFFYNPNLGISDLFNKYQYYILKVASVVPNAKHI